MATLTIPCNSRIATGVLNVAHTDPHSDAKVLRQAIELDTEGCAAAALADALASIASQSMQWLRAEGAGIIKVPIHGKNRWVLAPPRTLSAGLDWKGRGPDVRCCRPCVRTSSGVAARSCWQRAPRRCGWSKGAASA